MKLLLDQNLSPRLAENLIDLFPDSAHVRHLWRIQTLPFSASADAPLTFREFMTNEPLPLASIFREIFLFLTKRPDAVLFGAHAVNAYCEPERMTQDVNLLSTDGAALAEDLRAHLAATFHVAMRVREVVPGGFRIYQVQKPKNRHIADVRHVDALPPHEQVEGVLTVSPVELVALKTLSMSDRRGREKGLSDRLDLHRLLHAFPALKADEGPVAERLRALGASEAAFETWRDVVRERGRSHSRRSLR